MCFPEQEVSTSTHDSYPKLLIFYVEKLWFHYISWKYEKATTDLRNFNYLLISLDQWQISPIEWKINDFSEAKLCFPLQTMCKLPLLAQRPVSRFPYYNKYFWTGASSKSEILRSFTERLKMITKRYDFQVENHRSSRSMISNVFLMKIKKCHWSAARMKTAFRRVT